MCLQYSRQAYPLTLLSPVSSFPKTPCETSPRSWSLFLLTDSRYVSFRQHGAPWLQPTRKHTAKFSISIRRGPENRLGNRPLNHQSKDPFKWLPGQSSRWGRQVHCGPSALGRRIMRFPYATTPPISRIPLSSSRDCFTPTFAS